MSKLATDTVQEAVASILKHSTEKKRNFLETIELQVALKNYDPQKDKRFSGSIDVPNTPRDNFNVCLLGTEKDCGDATKAGIFPSVFNAGEDIATKVLALKQSVKFQLKSKKTTCMGVAIANVAMKENEATANIILAVNFLVSLLPKNWQNIKRLYIKSP